MPFMPNNAQLMEFEPGHHFQNQPICSPNNLLLISINNLEKQINLKTYSLGQFEFPQGRISEFLYQWWYCLNTLNHSITSKTVYYKYKIKALIGYVNYDQIKSKSNPNLYKK